MIARTITDSLLLALSDTPVVALNGARQTGKSTLARAICQGAHPATYLTMDDADVLDAATRDAGAFLRGLPGPVILDEVQRVPELLLAVKASVDRERTPGKFLLTGSAQLLLLPRLADTLAGRVELLTLWPFSQGEIGGVRERFIERLFLESPDAPLVSSTTARALAVDRGQMIEAMLRGGFPEAVARSSASRRAAWFASYITTATERTVRDIADIAGLPDLRRVLLALAARSGSLVNYADLSRTLSIPQTTLRRYVSLLEIAFLVQRLPAWSVNVTSRLVKTPKAYVTDSGLLAHLLGADAARLGGDAVLLGRVAEGFVVAELMRQATWSSVPVRLYHFRTHVGREVDVVLEDSSGRIVGLEIKTTSSPASSDFAGLRALAEAAGPRFVRGVLLCLCERPLMVGPCLQSLPIPALWE